jgi:hypothetical protein
MSDAINRWSDSIVPQNLTLALPNRDGCLGIDKTSGVAGLPRH